MYMPHLDLPFNQSGLSASLAAVSDDLQRNVVGSGEQNVIREFEFIVGCKRRVSVWTQSELTSTLKSETALFYPALESVVT